MVAFHGSLEDTSYCNASTHMEITVTVVKKHLNTHPDPCSLHVLC